MARPRIEIDKEDFEKLCGLMCTKEEIAGFFDCSDDFVESEEDTEKMLKGVREALGEIQSVID